MFEAALPASRAAISTPLNALPNDGPPPTGENGLIDEPPPTLLVGYIPRAAASGEKSAPTNGSLNDVPPVVAVPPVVLNGLIDEPPPAVTGLPGIPRAGPIMYPAAFPKLPNKPTLSTPGISNSFAVPKNPSPGKLPSPFPKAESFAPNPFCANSFAVPPAKLPIPPSALPKP